MRQFTDDEKNDNWVRLNETIQHIELGKRITEDWVCDQFDYLDMVREFFPDFSRMHPERTDAGFRKHLSDTELVLQRVLSIKDKTGNLDIATYLDFLRRVVRLAREIIEIPDEEEDALCAMMTRTSLKRSTADDIGRVAKKPRRA